MSVRAFDRSSLVRTVRVENWKRKTSLVREGDTLSSTSSDAKVPGTCQFTKGGIPRLILGFPGTCLQ
jgi:hypothetical protein